MKRCRNGCHRLIVVSTFLVCAGVMSCLFAANKNELIVLTYHDVVPDTGKDLYATSRSAFVGHMDYLETHGYKPVSFAFLRKVDNGEADLPKNAVLLTFDDGLKSYADFVVPVLAIYQFPSVLSVVTSWAEGLNTPKEYHRKLLDWPAIRKLDQMPLVDVISHTHDLHHGVRSNRQGNESAAGVTRIYSPVTKRHETEGEFLLRIKLDLESTVDRFHKELGRNPVGITWPYGRFDGVIKDLAHDMGMDYQLTLEDGPTRVSDFPVLNRTMLTNQNVEDFVYELNFGPLHDEEQHFAEIRLDNFVGETIEDQDSLLSSMMARLKSFRVNTVVIHPFNKAGGKAFFQTADFPVATEILNRVTHQLHHRLGIRHVYLSLPGNFDYLAKQQMVTDLSRLVWFNGLVFNGQVSNEIGMIKQVVSHYHPRVRYGHYATIKNIQKEMGEAEASGKDYSQYLYDFVIIEANMSEKKDKLREQLLSVKTLPVKIMIAVQADNANVISLKKKFDTLDAMDIKHYGVLYNQVLYGEGDTAADTGT